MGIPYVRVPRYREWLVRNPFLSDSEVYQLEDTIGFRPAKYYRDGEFEPDTGSYWTRWDGERQFIWKDDPDDCLILYSDANRAAFLRLLQGFRSEPEWDRETYEAFEHACSKDD